MYKFEINESLQDLVDGLSRYELWHWLAIKDIKLRYKQTILGPFWFPVSLLIFAVGLAFIFSSFFGSTTVNFLPYVATGLAVWGFMTRCLSESCTTFSSANDTIGQIHAPLSVQLFRMIERNGLIFLHEFLAIILILMMYGMLTLQGFLLFVLSVPLIVLAIFGASLFLATVCLRYGDLSQIVDLVLRFLFFLTPVFWVPTGGTLRDTLILLNPFDHALILTRGALMYGVVSPISWTFTISCAFSACVIGFLMFAFSRRSIQFWI